MLLKRSDIYYFRWQIPLKLRAIFGKREIIKSLRTSDKLVAQLRAIPYLNLVHKVQKVLLMQALSQSEFEELIKSAWNNLNKRIPKRVRQFEADDDHFESVMGYIDALNQCYYPDQDRFVTSISQWPEAFEQCQIDPSRYGPGDQEKLLQTVLQLYHKHWNARASQLITAQHTPDSPPFPDFLNGFAQLASNQQPLSNYWSEFVDEKTSAG